MKNNERIITLALFRWRSMPPQSAPIRCLRYTLTALAKIRVNYSCACTNYVRSCGTLRGTPRRSRTRRASCYLATKETGARESTISPSRKLDESQTEEVTEKSHDARPCAITRFMKLTGKERNRQISRFNVDTFRMRKSRGYALLANGITFLRYLRITRTDSRVV